MRSIFSHRVARGFVFVAYICQIFCIHGFQRFPARHRRKRLHRPPPHAPPRPGGLRRMGRSAGLQLARRAGRDGSTPVRARPRQPRPAARPAPPPQGGGGRVGLRGACRGSDQGPPPGRLRPRELRRHRRPHQPAARGGNGAAPFRIPQLPQCLRPPARTGRTALLLHRRPPRTQHGLRPQQTARRRIPAPLGRGVPLRHTPPHGGLRPAKRTTT